MNFTILHFDSLNSTNTEAVSQAKRGAKEGLCVVARQQTAGRGRHGKHWISPENAGLYFSIVLRPQLEMRFLSLLTLMSAVAVFDVLEKFYGLKPDIKWVNDVHVNEKKICGILAETTETGKGLAVIVGIGINLSFENLPQSISAAATSIESETNNKPDARKLLENLTAQFSNFYEVLKGENGAENIRRHWIQRSSYAFGKEVRAVLTNEIITGKTCGIEENGALRIMQSDGQIITIQAGDVEMLRKIPNK